VDGHSSFRICVMDGVFGVVLVHESGVCVYSEAERGVFRTLSFECRWKGTERKGKRGDGSWKDVMAVESS
jgi:hypothetical protein